MNREQIIKKHFQTIAGEYDEMIRSVAPYYEQMTDALILSLPFAESMAPRVLDIGCGTGTITAKLLARCPRAEIVCLDQSENMLSYARERLSGHKKVSFVFADMAQYEFPGKFHAVVSSLALHHLFTDSDKKALYARIFDALAPGGVFRNADLVLGENEYTTAMYLEQWRAFMLKTYSPEEIEARFMKVHEEEDSPASLSAHMAWLAQAGFSEVDVFWKYFNFAVYGGVRKT